MGHEDHASGQFEEEQQLVAAISRRSFLVTGTAGAVFSALGAGALAEDNELLKRIRQMSDAERDAYVKSGQYARNLEAARKGVVPEEVESAPQPNDALSAAANAVQKSGKIIQSDIGLDRTKRYHGPSAQKASELPVKGVSFECFVKPNRRELGPLYLPMPIQIGDQCGLGIGPENIEIVDSRGARIAPTKLALVTAVHSRHKEYQNPLLDLGFDAHQGVRYSIRVTYPVVLPGYDAYKQAELLLQRRDGLNSELQDRVIGRIAHQQGRQQLMAQWKQLPDFVRAFMLQARPMGQSAMARIVSAGVPNMPMIERRACSAHGGKDSNGRIERHCGYRSDAASQLSSQIETVQGNYLWDGPVHGGTHAWNIVYGEHGIGFVDMDPSGAGYSNQGNTVITVIDPGVDATYSTGDFSLGRDFNRGWMMNREQVMGPQRADGWNYLQVSIHDNPPQLSVSQNDLYKKFVASRGL